MSHITEDTQPLTTLRDHAGELMAQLKRTQRPIILTVDGKAEAILQDPAAYQRLLNLAAHADVDEGIRQGLEQADRGEGRPASEFFDEMRQAYGIPR